MKDVMMCMIPNGLGAAQSEASATLGLVMKICIERYYEVFDEVLDRGDAIDPRARERGMGMGNSASPSPTPSPSASTSTSAHTQPGPSPFTIHGEEDELDDDMLVMPIGPTKFGHRSTNSNASGSNVPVTRPGPPSAWGSSASPNASGGSASASGTIKARGSGKMHRTQLSGSSASSSLVGARVKQFNTGASLTPSGSGTSLVSGAASSAGTSNYAYASMSKSKARSMISIEGGLPRGGKKGSISIGRGTLRGAPGGTIKGGGAGVEAVGVTAAGFFSPPSAGEGDGAGQR